MSSLGVDTLTVLAAVFAVAGAALAVVGVAGLSRRRLWLGSSGVLLALLVLVSGALCAVLALGLEGYRALTHEEVAARVYTRPTGPHRFEARFELPDGTQKTYLLAGDQIAVEAQILKWHPWANLLGLHTAYTLERVTGRYASIDDERSRPRTVYPLTERRRVDLIAWRNRLPWLAPLVDAEYGSGTFTAADRKASYEVRVSTTGLLVRPLR